MEDSIINGQAIPTGTAIINVDPSKDMSVSQLHAEVLGLQQYAEIRTVLSIEDVASATDDLGLFAKLKKAIDAKRKEYVDPINAHLKAVNDAFKSLSQPLERADVLTRSRIMDFKKEEARKAAEISEINRLRMEAARKEAALNDGELSEATQLIEEPVLPTKVQGEAATSGTMKVRKWEVEDLTSVPHDYLMIDSTKVGKVVRAGIPAIPGIRIWVEETLTIRGK